MAIGTTYRNDYVGTGAVSIYAYSFKIFAETDLRVIRTDTDGNETVLSYPVDFTVTGAGTPTGGNITLTAGNLQSNYKLSIERNRPFSQTTDLKNQSSFHLDVHENSFDHSVMLAQRAYSLALRGIHLPEGLPVGGYGLAIPSPVASTAIGWNASADEIVNHQLNVITPTSIDSVDVPFLQSGSGAVSQSTRARLRGSLNAFDFFSSAQRADVEAGTETLDVAAALRAAIDAAAGRRVRLPAGTYKLLSGIGVRQCWMDGEDMAGVILHFPDTGMDGWNPPSHSCMENLTMRGPDSASVGHGAIDSGAAVDVVLNKLILEKWGSYGINTGGSSERWKMSQIISRENIDQGFFLGAGTVDCVLDQCYAINNLRNGFDNNGQRNTFSNCHAIANGLPGGGIDYYGFVTAATTAHADSNRYIGCIARGNGQPGFHVVAAAGLHADYNSFISCHSEGNSGSSSNADGFLVGDGTQTGSVRHTAFVKCSAVGNQRSGFLIDGTSATIQHTKVDHCDAVSNGNIGIWAFIATDTRVEFCTALSNGTAQINISGTGATALFNREASGIPTEFFTLPAQAPGINTALSYIRGTGLTTDWRAELAAIYDASFVHQFLVLNGVLSGSAAAPTITKGGSHGAGWIKHDPSADQLQLGVSGDTGATVTPTMGLAIQESAVAGDTFLVINRVGVTGLRVTVGAADSGGAGFRVLRVAN